LPLRAKRRFSCTHSPPLRPEIPICHNRLVMCGRYRLSRRKQIIEEHFDCGSGEKDWSPRYNIAPTQPVPIIRQNPKEPRRELSLVRWGLTPNWSKDASGAARMINARSETAGAPILRNSRPYRMGAVAADKPPILSER
jgi:hypothetical protein